MPASDAALVVIECPHCGTRYQLPFENIGRRGRTVQCAHCGRSWQARAKAPPAPKEALVNDAAESSLDRKFEEEERRAAALRAEKRSVLVAGGDATALADWREGIEAEGAAARDPEHQRTLDEIKAAIAPRPKLVPPPDAATLQKQQQDFSRRQASFNQRLPMARLRRAARLTALGLLAVIVVAGLLGRTAVVTQFPQLAGGYAAIGLGVNIVGVEFRDVHTLKSLQQGAEVLTVDGRIASASSREVPVPQVIVTLLGDDGQAVYEWGMVPKATELEPGESVSFETQLNAPPASAHLVRLSFASGRASAPSPLTDAASAAGTDTTEE